jgi:outer membrane lipoprotein-sorting protein
MFQKPLNAVAMLLLFLLLASSVQAQSGREIMQFVEDRDTGEDAVMTMRMTLVSKDGQQRLREMESFRKSKGEDTWSLIFFKEPADVRNTGFLTYDYDAEGADDDQFMYLPALRKIKRIAGSDKAGSFMGSDFNYSDMSAPDLADFEFKYLQDAEVDGSKTWVVLSTPKSTDVMEEIGYSKKAVWVRQDNHMVVRVKAWVHRSKEVKFFEFKGLEEIEGVWFARRAQASRKLGNLTLHQTLIEYNDIQLNQGLEDDLFTQRRLEKGL